MANRLTKQGTLVYVPDIPEQLGRAAYCYQLNDEVRDPFLAWHYFLFGWPNTPPRFVCFPAIPYRPGRDASLNSSANEGWNAGAISRAAAGADCELIFKIAAWSTGVLAGIVPAEAQVGAFNAVTHGLLFSGGTVRVIEGGIEKADSGVQLAPGTPLRIRRVNRVVTYFVGGWKYASSAKISGDIRLGAVLYAAGDAVDEPKLVQLSTLSLCSPWGWADSKSRSRIALSSSWLWRGQLEINEARISEEVPFLVQMSEDDYGEIIGSVGGVTVSAIGGFIEIEASIISAVIPVSHLVEGSEVEGSDLNARIELLALGAEDDYGVMGASPAPVVVRGMDLGEPLGVGSCFDPVRVVDQYITDPVIYALIDSSLRAGSSFDLMLAIDGTIVDYLVVGDQIGASAILLALIESGLAISDNASQVRQEMLQYATNIATGAVSRYQGYEFKGFARTGMDTFGWKADGVYRLGGEDDDGAMIQAAIELAANDFGLTNHKRLDSLLIGASTDGMLFVKITDDHGVSTTHPVQVRGSEARSPLPKGRSSRFWRAQIIIEDATYASIDNIEWVVGATGRRTSR